ncbi:MAG: hypothetical protein CME32_15160 [Gimesia sp.]|nr:hypothetical protein [Gimesia sp.]
MDLNTEEGNFISRPRNHLRRNAQRSVQGIQHALCLISTKHTLGRISQTTADEKLKQTIANDEIYKRPRIRPPTDTSGRILHRQLRGFNRQALRFDFRQVLNYEAVLIWKKGGNGDQGQLHLSKQATSSVIRFWKTTKPARGT